MLDNVSGYRFALMAGNNIKSSYLDDKLDEIYKCFVNYVIKAPFFNVSLVHLFRNNKKFKTRLLKKRVIKFYTIDFNSSYAVFSHFFYLIFTKINELDN